MAKETRKEAIMRILKCSAEEADSIIADDKAVDRDEAMDWDLSPEEHKAAMKFANADEKKKPVQPVKRERKANATKGLIIAEIATFLRENSEICAEMVEITNKERQIAFKIGDDSFEITLTQKRKPKS